MLGGLGSIPGAMLGGVLLGLAETFAAALPHDLAPGTGYWAVVAGS